MRWRLALLALTSSCRISFEPVTGDASTSLDDASEIDSSVDATTMTTTLTFGERTTSMFQGVTSDALLDGGSPTLNFGASQITSVYAPGGEERGIVRFDVTAIPANARITTATLQLSIEASGDLVAGTMEVHVVTESWLEGTGTGMVSPGVTWLSRDGITAWTSPGGSTSSTIGIVGSVACGVVPGPVDVPLTPLTIDRWLDTPSTNFGLLLRTPGGHWHPYTSNAPDTDARPQLVVEVEL